MSLDLERAGGLEVPATGDDQRVDAYSKIKDWPLQTELTCALLGMMSP